MEGKVKTVNLTVSSWIIKKVLEGNWGKRVSTVRAHSSTPSTKDALCLILFVTDPQNAHSVSKNRSSSAEDSPPIADPRTHPR